MPVLIQRIADLIVRHLREELNSQEDAELQRWVGASVENRNLFERLTHEKLLQEELIEFHESRKDVWKKIDESISAKPVIMRSRKSRNYLAAASVVVLIAAGIFLWIQYQGNKSVIAKTPGPDQQIIQDVAPGGDRAVLTLSDGSIISLDSAQNGMLARQGNFSIVKAENGKIVYDGQQPAFTNDNSSLTYNTVRTPKGGQYHITLPDGSNVWLNAASSIRYPTSFKSHERRVEITGEVYFEISPLLTSPSGGGGKSKIPFIVTTISASGKTSEIEVLGTHFNVNAYADEMSINTTLLEGSVRITTISQSEGQPGKRSFILKPGQQSQVSKEDKIFVVNEINTEDVVAWKNGMFQFGSVDIETIMRQVTRWYNIDVEYRGAKPVDKFRGAINRNVNLSELLKILELSEVHFKLEGRKLIVMP
jgi:ferric-dicitrate binding protein FerR (iron transport regulator)